ncbi:MAG: hypothetical protein ACI4TD_09050 [Phocaeicola sp.]
MEEYTYDNIIINPTKEGIESLIGKEVYFHENPSICLERANKDSLFGSGILVKIRKDLANPFHVEQSNGVCVCPCIIPKKELKPEFVPFESADEFLEEYNNANYSVNSGTLENKLLNYGGVWLKSKKDDSLCMVAGIRDNGLVICDKERTISDPIEYNVKMSWAEILSDFVFLDGTPCGMNSLRRPDDE